jgi:hypothetical protein
VAITPQCRFRRKGGVLAVFCATDSFGVLSCAAHISSRAVLGQLGWSFLQRGTARRWGSFPECPLGPAPGLRKPASAGRAHQRHQTADNGDHANAPCSCVTPFLLAVNHQEGSLPLSGYAANRRRVRRLRRLKTMEWSTPTTTSARPQQGVRPAVPLLRERSRPTPPAWSAQAGPAIGGSFSARS